MRYKIWNAARPDPQVLARLTAEGIHPLGATVLAARGLSSAQQARDFLFMADTPLPDGATLKDMDRAVSRVRLALNRGEKIAVYGDYDVDGITATCLLTRYLTEQGADVLPYIPGRLEEGYGLNCDAISALSREGVTLIITVDCGITAVDEVLWAASLGVDVVVTDHHECKNVLPAACAVVDPHRPDCPYPFKGLAGVGVALKLAMALAGPDGQERVLNEYSDLAAIGTVADVMPVVGENRTIIQRGLRTLEQNTRPGIAALIREAGLDGRPIHSTAIGYTLAPRINAAGRMGCARLAVDLLLTDDPLLAAEWAQELCRLNRERQSVEADIFDQCCRQLAKEPQQDAIVLADESWHQGVVGIVASRLCEKYGHPSMMICLSDGLGKGSCRSWGGVNLFAVLEGCQDLLEGFGGHELAAGFTVRQENIPALAQRAAELVRAQRKSLPEAVALDVDAFLDDPSILDLRGVELLDKLEPYGSGNPRPVLALTDTQVLSRTTVGNGRHLKLKLGRQGFSLDAILFSAGGLLPAVGSRLDVAFSPQINEFRGERSVQLQIIDLRPAADASDLYEKFSQGETLTAAEASRLIPDREQFVLLWRWLKQQSDRGLPVCGTAGYIAKSVSRSAGGGEDPLLTRICLDVMCERGLILLDRTEQTLRVELIPTQEKVDLEASPILCRLRSMAEYS